MPARAHALAAAGGAEDEHADGQQHRADIGEIDWEQFRGKKVQRDAYYSVCRHDPLRTR
jgi:hypothetical protein